MVTDANFRQTCRGRGFKSRLELNSGDRFIGSRSWRRYSQKKAFWSNNSCPPRRNGLRLFFLGSPRGQGVIGEGLGSPLVRRIGSPANEAQNQTAVGVVPPVQISVGMDVRRLYFKRIVEGRGNTLPDNIYFYLYINHTG